MKKLVWLVVLGMQFSFAQNVVKHRVTKGETITQIAKKYKITPSEIYKLNPDAQKGVDENTMLVIALPGKSVAESKKKEEKKSEKKTDKEATVVVKHEVQPKETLYTLSKQYGTTVEEIEKSNPEVKNGLGIGQVLTITAKKGVAKKQEPKKQEPVYHTVETKETKYGIAKKYGLTVEELEKKNPEIVNGLQVGQVLLIKGERPKPVEIVKTETPKEEPPVAPKAPNQGIAVVEKTLSTIGYTIQPKETLYSLSRQFNITQEELIKMNPELKDGVKEGMLIDVPVKPELKTVVKKELTNLTESIQVNGKKKLALLLPFNIAKLDQDTINSTKSRLKKDKFLNMTLDFYAGALIAVDSAKAMGLNVDVLILDSDETKSTSNVVNLIQDNNLKNMNAIIGPFYQNNAEKAASLLGNVPVISPLSKDYDKKFPNLIQATTMPDDIKQAMFDFMRNKGGNIVAVVDPKKGSVKQYIESNHKDVQFAAFNAKGGLDVAQLKTLLVKDKMNYVIMETEKTNLILSTTSALTTWLKEYQINLVILGENEALDFEEIPMSRLTKLKMHYPSVSRPNKSEEAEIFENNFKKKNKVFPNQFATRGFDVTLDVLLRLNQEKSFMETFDEIASEQVESEFNYVQNPDGGYMNKGVHILYYDTDLTIKEAK
ncbi:LysM peptidoglycan-binding domain-containing protein [Flavobacterium sp. GCM10023249]|uniref:LysM peptidoglycan-binding domain-containing protein n=1 Tax=unclassified Flavobacterium TaxID=196869 RepID=UPI003614AF24